MVGLPAFNYYKIRFQFSYFICTSKFHVVLQGVFAIILEAMCKIVQFILKILHNFLLMFVVLTGLNIFKFKMRFFLKKAESPLLYNQNFKQTIPYSPIPNYSVIIRNYLTEIFLFI